MDDAVDVCVCSVITKTATLGVMAAIRWDNYVKDIRRQFRSSLLAGYQATFESGAKYATNAECMSSAKSFITHTVNYLVAPKSPVDIEACRADYVGVADTVFRINDHDLYEPFLQVIFRMAGKKYSPAKDGIAILDALASQGLVISKELIGLVEKTAGPQAWWVVEGLKERGYVRDDRYGTWTKDEARKQAIKAEKLDLEVKAVRLRKEAEAVVAKEKN